MKLFDNLKKAAAVLETSGGGWAICGGIAACLYRREPRFTGDIDIAIVDGPQHSARERAEQIISELGYEPILGFTPKEDGSLSKEVSLIVGREDTEGTYVGIDFILPLFPWVAPAVNRAKDNLVDYGFSKLPTVPLEDLVIAKLFAIRSTPTRPYDLDDILSMLSGPHEIDHTYLTRRIEEFNLPVPESVQSVL